MWDTFRSCLWNHHIVHAPVGHTTWLLRWALWSFWCENFPVRSTAYTPGLSWPSAYHRLGSKENLSEGFSRSSTPCDNHSYPTTMISLHSISQFKMYSDVLHQHLDMWHGIPPPKNHGSWLRPRRRIRRWWREAQPNHSLRSQWPEESTAWSLWSFMKIWYQYMIV